MMSVAWLQWWRWGLGQSVLVRVRHPRQVAVGAVILVGAIGGAAVVLGVGRRRRRAVVLV